MLSNQQGGQAGIESAVEYSTIDLEWIIIELIHLLDRDFPSGSTLVKEVLSLACESKRTVLHLSAALGFHELLGEIIQHEVDLNQPDICGCTALHYAALYGHLTGATLLIYGGANAEVTDRWGRLAAELATDSDHHDIEEMLNAWKPGIYPNASTETSAGEGSLSQEQAMEAPNCPRHSSRPSSVLLPGMLPARIPPTSSASKTVEPPPTQLNPLEPVPPLLTSGAENATLTLSIVKASLGIPPPIKAASESALWIAGVIEVRTDVRCGLRFGLNYLPHRSLRITQITGSHSATM